MGKKSFILGKSCQKPCDNFNIDGHKIQVKNKKEVYLRQPKMNQSQFRFSNNKLKEELFQGFFLLF